MFGALAKKPSEGASGLARFDSSSSVARRGGNEGEGVIPDPAELFLTPMGAPKPMDEASLARALVSWQSEFALARNLWDVAGGPLDRSAAGDAAGSNVIRGLAGAPEPSG